VSSQGESGPKGPLDHLIYYLGAAGMLGLFGAVFYGVSMRYLFNRPPLWSVDVPNLLFIWLVFITVGLTTRLGPQIRVVFFLEKMRPRNQRWLMIAAHVAILVMIAAFIWYSLPIIELSSGETMLSTGWNGSIYFYALPIGSVIMGYYQIQALIGIIRGGHDQAMLDGAR
jgi:C4-dicarboxylate transporter, DctQ subunit